MARGPRELRKMYQGKQSVHDWRFIKEDKEPRRKNIEALDRQRKEKSGGPKT